jgi:hypothetical protein
MSVTSILKEPTVVEPRDTTHASLCLCIQQRLNSEVRAKVFPSPLFVGLRSGGSCLTKVTKKEISVEIQEYTAEWSRTAAFQGSRGSGLSRRG